MVRDMTEDPFETVVAAHHAEIHRYLVRATSRPGDADDLSQETFVRAYKAYRSLPPDANVRAWLFTIATNLCRNHFRAEGRRRQAMVAAAAGASERGPSWPEGEAIASQASARMPFLDQRPRVRVPSVIVLARGGGGRRGARAPRVIASSSAGASRRRRAAGSGRGVAARGVMVTVGTMGWGRGPGVAARRDHARGPASERCPGRGAMDLHRIRDGPDDGSAPSSRAGAGRRI